VQSKRLVLITSFLVLLAGMAFFAAGRMFNGSVKPLISDEPPRGGSVFTFSASNNIIPAIELPTTPPEVTGLFFERKDNTMIIQAMSFDPGIGGILGDSVDVNSAPEVEILMTAKTSIYRDTTQESPSSAENSTIQQTVGESTLDPLTPPTMITVWGRKSGDRIIAEVLLFSNSLNFPKP
jgi:hypothetical protein